MAHFAVYIYVWTMRYSCVSIDPAPLALRNNFDLAAEQPIKFEVCCGNLLTTRTLLGVVVNNAHTSSVGTLYLTVIVPEIGTGLVPVYFTGKCDCFQAENCARLSFTVCSVFLSKKRSVRRRRTRTRSGRSQT